jgi:hypothetical protein
MWGLILVGFRGVSSFVYIRLLVAASKSAPLEEGFRLFPV